MGFGSGWSLSWTVGGVWEWVEFELDGGWGLAVGGAWECASRWRVGGEWVESLECDLGVGVRGVWEGVG